MSVLSGKGGSLSFGGSVVSTVRNWKINRTGNNPKGTPSNAGAMQIVTPGTSDWTGSFDFYGYDLPANPGTSYAGIFWNGTKRTTGTLLVTGVNFTCDIENGGLISGTCTFGGQGALSHSSSSTTLSDASAPLTFSGKAGKASWQPIIAGTLGSAADIPDVRNWSLAIQCTDNPYNGSGTAGVTSRTAGVFSASASVGWYQSDTETLGASATRLEPGTPGILKLYSTASLFYGLTYAVVNAEGIEDDIEGGANNAVVCGFDYSGYAVISSTNTRGSLAKPTGGDFWP